MFRKVIGELNCMEIVDYEILVQKLVPPMGGGRNYYAVIQFLVVRTDEGSEHVSLDLGETYGKTEEEARSKMQAKYDVWCKSNV